MTWNEAVPASLPPASAGHRILGVLRVGAIAGTTLVLGVVFICARLLRGLFGRRIGLHVPIVRVWARACVWLIGMRCERRGTPVASGALVANHCSWSDIVVLRSICPVCFVSKADVAGWPGIGFLAGMADTVFIERRRVEAKRQEAVLRERIAADDLLCFFPEGTSTDGLRVLPFKSSLFSAFFTDAPAGEVWVQPVSIRYRAAEGSALPEDFFGWWGAMSFGGHLLSVMERSFGSRVVVAFHDPVRPADFADRKVLADHCRSIVAEGHSAAAR